MICPAGGETSVFDVLSHAAASMAVETASFFLRVKRSSWTAATIRPSPTSAAALSW
jgi:hypothetical protein